MLDIKFIRENPDVVKTAAKNKLINVDIDRLLQVDEDLRKVSQEADTLKEERNKLSSSIPSLSNEEKQKTIAYVKELKEKITILDEKIEPLKKEFTDLMYQVPGIPFEEVPIGKDDEENVEIKRVGEIPTFDFEIKDHVDLAESLDLIDVPRAVKIAGSRSYYLKNEAVLLEMALCRYVIDKLVKKGYKSDYFVDYSGKTKKKGGSKKINAGKYRFSPKINIHREVRRADPYGRRDRLCIRIYRQRYICHICPHRISF